MVRYKGTTHGSWCNTKTRPSRCKHCGTQVYYFSCDHESQVFFEKLGEPWPIHDCKEYRNAQHKKAGKVVTLIELRKEVVNYFKKFRTRNGLSASDIMIASEHRIRTKYYEYVADVVLLDSMSKPKVMVVCERIGGMRSSSNLRSYLRDTNTPLGVFTTDKVPKKFFFYENHGDNKINRISREKFEQKLYEVCSQLKLREVKVIILSN